MTGWGAGVRERTMAISGGHPGTGVIAIGGEQTTEGGLGKSFFLSNLDRQL